MNFLVWIIFGALAGWIASIIMGKNAKMGALANIVVGIVGAFIGSYIIGLVGIEVEEGFNIANLLIAIFGATVLLFIVGFFSRRR